MPENDDTWELWQSIATQWRAGGMGLVGLDYPAVALVAELLEIDFDSVMIKKIGAMEREVLGSKQSDVPEYCQACISSKNNTTCSTCDLTTVKKRKVDGQ